ncbi:TPA: Arc family DNA-binding protein [Yersinia enterocolitica]|uniref:Arc family DNA-binding protein n=1 Tax=Yersinia enterocolitica TaxID=630 RepID=UPI00155A676C|nr:Arc family DNA-binding protein [Yersinia enterocolitica]EKN6261112.1 Arc family DNA-binding protein [Yersinia enterocolitica]MBX9485667.1 Arc family DNA-binding protein [Yersinia enterocolitica]NQS93888.1 Arc family DNA-binding protein [Yersinia enterocolitica]NQT44361.1 Arc family DNA-binding protein [Yersinia enterocolitica]NQU02128.1 Arc family DNA-binding protein [Yersinia enterocolitica]
MARNDPQFNVRMPADLKEKLTTLAEENGRSINAEIVKAIEDAIDRQKAEKLARETYTQYTADVTITDPNRLLYTIEQTKKSGKFNKENIDNSALENIINALVKNTKVLEAALEEFKNKKE